MQKKTTTAMDWILVVKTERRSESGISKKKSMHRVQRGDDVERKIQGKKQLSCRKDHIDCGNQVENVCTCNNGNNNDHEKT